MGVPGSEVLLRGGGEPLVDALSPAAASVSRNSTQRREKDLAFGSMSKSMIKMTGVELTSVSSVLSSSCPLAEELPAGERDQKESGGAIDECARCRPAFSRSRSVHESMVARRESISNRFASARGVVRNARRTFVTRRRSTLVSDELRLSRRRASMRCSLIITAI